MDLDLACMFVNSNGNNYDSGWVLGRTGLLWLGGELKWWVGGWGEGEQHICNLKLFVCETEWGSYSKVIFQIWKHIFCIHYLFERH